MPAQRSTDDCDTEVFQFRENCCRRRSGRDGENDQIHPPATIFNKLAAASIVEEPLLC
jgi:hypothetical protein